MENENLVRVAKFCLHHEVDLSFMVSLQEFGLINIVEIDEEQYVFQDELSKLERMVRLHYDLGVNFEGIDAIGVLLQQIDVLHQELRSLKNRLVTFAP